MKTSGNINVLKSRYQAVLHVIQARLDGAGDADDWAVIEIQTRELHRIAKRARLTFSEETNG